MISSNVVRKKKDRVTWKDLFHNKETVEKRRTGKQNKLETQVIKPIWIMLVGWKVTERMRMVLEMRKEKDNDTALVGKKVLSGEEVTDNGCKRLDVVPYNQTVSHFPASIPSSSVTVILGSCGGCKIYKS